MLYSTAERLPDVSIDQISEVAQPLHLLARDTTTLKMIKMQQNYPLASHLFDGPTEVPSSVSDYIFPVAILAILLGIAGSVYLASRLKNPNQQRQHSLLDAASNEISNKRLQDEMDASRQYTEENYRVF